MALYASMTIAAVVAHWYCRTNAEQIRGSAQSLVTMMEGLSDSEMKSAIGKVAVSLADKARGIGEYEMVLFHVSRWCSIGLPFVLILGGVSLYLSGERSR